MKNIKNNRHRLFILTGIILMLCAAIFSLINFLNSISAGMEAGDALRQVTSAIATINLEKDDKLHPANAYEGDDMVAITYREIDYIGELTIPAIDISLPVISNWSYPNLKLAPCRYSGTISDNSMIIAAHNYNSHFGRLNKLSVGNKIMFTDMNGMATEYEVTYTELLNDTDVNELELMGDWDLTLFTCTTGGEMRVTVRCKRVM